MTCSQASWRKRFPSMASAENSLHTSQKRVWVPLRCRQGSRRHRNIFRCSRWAGRVWLTFRRLLTHETESEQTRHFYGLFARLRHCLFDERRMKIESSILSSPGTELTGNSTVGAEQFYGWSMCSKNYQKKKRNYRIRGGGDGAGGRVRVCQVNVTRITRKVFKILNFVFGNLSFVFRSPYSTVCSHMEQSAKLGSPNWTLGRKVSRQIDHRGLWSGRQKYFLVANGD